MPEEVRFVFTVRDPEKLIAWAGEDDTEHGFGPAVYDLFVASIEEGLSIEDHGVEMTLIEGESR